MSSLTEGLSLLDRYMKWLKNRKTLQLWTNADRTEYAIYVEKSKSDKTSGSGNNNNNKLIVQTNNDGNIKYSRLLDESDYLEDLEYDWKYTLEHWIGFIVRINGDKLPPTMRISGATDWYGYYQFLTHHKENSGQ
jgi:hypothetical protein